MHRDADEIAALYKARQARLAGRRARQELVSDVYGGRTVLPLPELEADEQAAVPNLTQLGADQMARRVASVLPVINCPPLRPGIDVSEAKASDRRLVHYGWWDKNRIRKQLGIRAKWWITYSSGPAVVRPDQTMKMPRWEPFSPRDVYPAATHIGSYTPPDVLLRHRRDFRWVQDNYPDAALRVKKKRGTKPHDLFDVMEYIDGDDVCMVLMSNVPEDTLDADMPGFQSEPGHDAVELAHVPNRAGVCWAVLPERPGLDSPMGQFDNIIGMYKTQAALVAMEILAVKRAIWPDVWLENPNGPIAPSVVQTPDRATGTPGVVTNGRIAPLNLDPSYRSSTTINNLEASQRQTAGLPAEFGGMSQSDNVRTGRRASQIMGASIDFTIAEAQDAFAEALHEESVRAREIDKAYFDFRKSMYVSAKGMRGKITYQPSEVFEEHAEVLVEYPQAGTDLSDLVINGGQRVGMGTMSKRSFMEIDPLIPDAEIEESRVRLEQTEAVFFNAFGEQMSQPDAPWQAAQVAEFAKRMATGEKWYVAVDGINKELQEKQAEGAEAGSPEAMPGLAVPGAPGTIPSIGEPEPSMDNLTSLLSQLGTAQQAMKFR